MLLDELAEQTLVAQAGTCVPTSSSLCVFSPVSDVSASHKLAAIPTVCVTAPFYMFHPFITICCHCVHVLYYYLNKNASAPAVLHLCMCLLLSHLFMYLLPMGLFAFPLTYFCHLHFHYVIHFYLM